MNLPGADAVETYLRELQQRITDAFAQREPAASFRHDAWTRDGGGGGEARVLEGLSLIHI